MRVVCVDDVQRNECSKEEFLLRRGQIYTVRRAGDFDYSFPWGVHYSFWLSEITREDDTPFGAFRFRPLDESRLDQFRVHLNPKKVEEKIDA